jgi:aminoglycoside 3-N-acetyltransferase I
MDGFDFTTRRLISGDTQRFEELNALFAEVFGDADSHADARPRTVYLEGLLATDMVIPLVAMANGEIIGGLVAYELRKFERERSEIYIYDLAVAAPHRRRGVATALIRDLQSIAKERGAWVIFVQADYGDVPAIALYSKLGVREDVIHFDISPAM